MKVCYFVIGAENSGTKMLMSALISAGCYGDDTDAQRLDTYEFDRLPDRIAFRRSVPHGCEELPGLNALARMMTQADYQVRPLMVYRSTTFLASGQIRRGYAETEEHVKDRLGTALKLYMEVCRQVCAPPLIVPYEAFVDRREYREELFNFLWLPPPSCGLYNANEAYGELAAVPW